jgi:hypothetical protein
MELLILEIFAIVGWVGWVGTLIYYHRKPSPTAPKVSKRAQLLHAGVLESVRTIEGEPPAVLQCAAGTYRLDRTAGGDHWVYRR